MGKIINGSSLALALANYLCTNAYLNDTAQDVLIMVGNWIDEAQEITVPKWIPVSERLPEVGAGNVLVARLYKGKPYVDIGEFIAGTACCWGDEYAINPREHITTHWMPLPNPPEEERQ